MKQDPLLENLRLAFPPMPIDAANAFEQRGTTYCDAAEYRSRIQGKTWEQLDPQFIARRVDALSFLGTQHVVAMLPMYLHLLIVFAPTSPVPETLVPALTKPERDETIGTSLVSAEAHFEWKRRFFEGLTRMLTERQSSVVAAALQHFVAAAPCEAEAAQRALERYWYRFLPGGGTLATKLDLLRVNPLLPELRAAFPPTAIMAADAFERHCHGADEFRDAIDGKSWDRLDPVFMARECSALWFLSDRHFVELLPLYLHLLLVMDIPRLSDCLMPRLTRSVAGDPFCLHGERFDILESRFSGAQKSAVAATLISFLDKRPRDAPAAQRALDRYWGAFSVSASK